MLKVKQLPINLNNYVRPNPHTLVKQSNKYVTNGVDNDFFYYVERCYIGSPTTQCIIDNIVNYIIADGLEVVAGNVDLKSILSEEDLRNFVTDFKVQGQGYFQVIYGYSKEKRTAKLIYIPTKSIAIEKQADLSDDIEGYWYCFDWKNKSTFKPYKIPAFGYGINNETEILCIKRQSPQPLFALPDWVSGLQFSQIEEELSNYYISHIQNNFSAGKVVNIYQGKDWTDEAMEAQVNAISRNLTGTSNAGTPIISFNDNPDSKTTVESIEITDAYQQFETLEKSAREKIMMSHKVNDPGLFGLPTPTGFSSAADQQVQALKILYRSQINPMRTIITKGIEKALKLNDPSIEIAFVDYEELRVQAPAQTPATQMKSIKMAGMKVGFDFDETANTAKGKEWVAKEIADNNDVYLISARSDDSALKEYADANGIAPSRVYATGSNEAKVAKVLELALDVFYDNNPDVTAQLPGVGRTFNN
jgi:hypothetical protein